MQANDQRRDFRFHRELMRRFLLFLVPMTALLLVVLGLIFSISYRVNFSRISTQENTQLDMLSGLIASEFTEIATDLQVLARSNALQALLDTNTADNRDAVASNFLLFSQQKQRYDQIRYLDVEGNEVVRVNFNNGDPVVVADEQLQNKAGRYYFDDTLRLEAGGVFVSPLDLNIEQGAIEQPLKPMIRFGVPVFNSAGEKRGIVLLNYFGADLLAQLDMHHNDLVSEVMLVNADGYWLKGPVPENLWGFMYEDRQDLTFGNLNPAVWEQITAADRTQFLDGELYTGTTIFPLEATWQSSTGAGEAFAPSEAPVGADAYYWKLLSVVPASLVSPAALGALDTLIIAGAAAFAVLLAAAYGVAWLATKRAQGIGEIEEQRAALAEKNTVYQALFEQSNDAVVLLGTDGVVRQVNQRMCELLGYTESELVGFRIDKWVVDPAAKFYAIREDVMRGEPVAPFVCALRKKRGKTLWVEVNIEAVFDDAGEVMHIQSLLRDITERRKAELALHEYGERMKSLLETQTTFVIRTDMEGRYTYVNDAMYTRFGWKYDSKDTMIGQPRLDTILSDDHETMRAAVAECAAQPGKPVQVEVRKLTETGQVVPVLWEFTAVTDLDGEVDEIQCVGIDLTEQKLLQQRQMELTLEKERGRFLRDFIRDAAHEFRTPLTVINSAVYLLAGQDDPEKRLQKAKQVEASVERITRLVDDLTLLVQLNSDDAANMQRAPVKPLLDTVARRFIDRCDKHHQYRLDVADGDLFVNCDPGLITEMLDRLMDNACRFTPPGEGIEIKVYDNDSAVFFEVRDNGPGISETKQAMIFDSFWREDSTHLTPGFGLGLPIAKRIAERHGGGIELETAVDKGSLFRVWLPRATSDEPVRGGDVSAIVKEQSV